MTLCKKCCRELDMIPVRKCGQVECRNCHKRRWSYWCVTPYSKRKDPAGKGTDRANLKDD